MWFKLINKKGEMMISKFRKSQKGATMIEYVLLAALIAVICIVAIQSIGRSASNAYSKIASTLCVAVK